MQALSILKSKKITPEQLFMISVLAVNGEIYNHKELAEKLTKPHNWQTFSDCEVLLYLYDEFGNDFLNKLDGIFQIL